MELRQLRYLDAVARHRHFTRAAEELHVAQSALSQQIRKLEAELGVALLERTTRSVELTEAGELVLARARQALAETEALRREVEELRGLVRGTVGVGALRPAGEVDVPALLAEFNRRHPGVEIQFREGTVAEMIAHLRAGEIDASFALEAAPVPADLEWLPLSSEELVVAMSPAHRLAGPGPIAYAELDGAELIAFRRGSAVRAAMDEALEAAGARPRILLEGSNEMLVRAMISQGLGVGIVPRTVAELAGPPLAVRSLRPRISLAVGLMWRRQRAHSPAVRAFLNFVAEHAGGAGEDSGRDRLRPPGRG
jgi:DNA-binding transcriptional LysR family regulator